MSYSSVIRDYFLWHYGQAYADIFRVWRNYLWFVLHLFSVKNMLLSLFSPWKRMKEKPVNFFARPGDFFGNIVVDLLMRILGASLRMSLVLLGLLVFVCILTLGSTLLIVWTVLPVLLILLLGSGITLVI